MSKLSANLISTLTHTMDDISKTNDNNLIYDNIKVLLKEFVDSDFSTLLLYDPIDECLYSKNNNKINISTQSPRGLIGQAFLAKSPLITNNAITHKEYVSDIDALDNRRLDSQMLYPILENDTLIAMLYISRSTRYSKPFTQSELSLLSSLQLFLVKIVHVLTSDTQPRFQVETTLTETSAAITDMIKDPSSKTQYDMVNFSNIIHDIRTPANGLYGFLQLLENHIEDKQLKMFISDAMESAKLINTLTTTILDESKQTLQVKVENLTIINSTKYFVQIANLFSANMYDKKINFIIYIDPDLPKELKLNELKLKRVIMNLLGNAYKFTAPGRHIYFNILYDTHKEQLTVSIEDEGIGIEENKQKEIFKAFKQAEETTYDEFGGTGLGLSISSNLVTELGGELKLRSIVDVGSTFSFIIPVQVYNKEISYPKFLDLKKKINILTNELNNSDAQNIEKYLIASGMPKEIIDITNVLVNPTHLVCFEHKLTPNIIKFTEERDIELLIIEEKLFSVSMNKLYKRFSIASANTYYGDKVHALTFTQKATRVLIADNNKINIRLLESMLATEHVHITTVEDGRDALNEIEKSFLHNIPYEVMFVTHTLPIYSGFELIKKCREFENTYNVQALLAISTTCMHFIEDENVAFYNLCLQKPFNKVAVRNAISKKV